MESLSPDNEKIFNSIATIATSPEFHEQQTEFYNLKMKLFDADEENKLEYTNIYQDYIQLMEQIIDVTLKEEQYGHSEEQVKEFYRTFKDNIEIYKGMNEDVMDVLFGLVDFAKFKESILQYKKGMVDAGEDDIAKENRELIKGKQGLEYDEFLKEFNLDLADKKNGWVRKITQGEKDFDKKGIMMNMWQKKNEVKGRPDWLRFDCSMKNVSNKEAILDCMRDPQIMAQGSDMIKEFKIFEDDGAGTQKIYWRMKMPMMSERDNVALMKYQKMEGDIMFFQFTSIEDDRYPPVKNVVRMFQHVTGYQRPHPTIPNCLDYTEIDQMDMKGNFPARLLNMVMASASKAEFEKLYKFIKDKEE